MQNQTHARLNYEEAREALAALVQCQLEFGSDNPEAEQSAIDKLREFLGPDDE